MQISSLGMCHTNARMKYFYFIKYTLKGITFLGVYTSRQQPRIF